MEFLQDWRYGVPHNIYEYTHPHLAKYAMALGHRALRRPPGDRPEPARQPRAGCGHRTSLERQRHGGVRAWRPAVRAHRQRSSRSYDLADRTQVAALPTDGHGSDGGYRRPRVVSRGRRWRHPTLDTTALDDAASERSGRPDTRAAGDPQRIGIPRRLEIADDTLVILDADGTLEARSSDTGDLLASAALAGAADVVAVGGTDMVVAVPADIEDISGTAQVLADDLGLDVDAVTDQLETGGTEVVLAAGWTAVADQGPRSHHGRHPCGRVGRPATGHRGLDRHRGLVPGCRQPVVADRARHGRRRDGHGVGRQRAGFARLYVASGPELRSISIDKTGPQLKSTVEMPGDISDIVWNAPAHSWSTRWGSCRTARPPSTSSTHMATRCSRTCRCHSRPSAAVADTQPDRPSQDRTQLLGAGRRRCHRQRRHRWQRVGLSLAGRAHGRGHRRLPVPPGTAALPAPVRGPVRGGAGARGRDAVRQLTHRHERRVRPGLPDHGHHPVRAHLAGQLASRGRSCS